MQRKDMTEIIEAPASVIARAKKHDEERVELDKYFAPIVEDWVDLQFQAGNFSRDDKMRGYWYEQTSDDAVIFFSSAQYRDDRGDYDPLEEKYIYVPISFITGENDTHRAELAEMIETRKAELARAEEERIQRRAAFAAV